MRLVQNTVYKLKLELPSYLSSLTAKDILEENYLFTDTTVWSHNGYTHAQTTWPGVSGEIELPRWVKQVEIVKSP